MVEVKKSKRDIRRDKRIQRHVEALKESEAKIGQLIPVIEDKFGVVSGNKRLAANPNWRRKTIVTDNEYEHWKSVANGNVQLEPSKEEWKTWVNNAIQALKKDNKEMSNTDIVKKLVNEFGLPRWRIYELIPDDYKREYNRLKADGNFEGDDESKLSESRQLPKEDVKVKGMTELELEKLLISELEKAGIQPETKVALDRPYKYSQPYFADIKIGNIVMDIVGKSSVEEVEERDSYFRKKGLYPVHVPGPVIKKYAPFVASLVKSFMSFVSMYELK